MWPNENLNGWRMMDIHLKNTLQFFLMKPSKLNCTYFADHKLYSQTLHLNFSRWEVHWHLHPLFNNMHSLKHDSRPTQYAFVPSWSGVRTSFTCMLIIILIGDCLVLENWIFNYIIGFMQCIKLDSRQGTGTGLPLADRHFVKLSHVTFLKGGYLVLLYFV